MKGPDGKDAPASAEAWPDQLIDDWFNRMMNAGSSAERHFCCDQMAAAAKGRSVRLQMKMLGKLKDLDDYGGGE